MRFLTLTEIGERHADEEGTDGMRVATLNFAASKLQSYELQRDILRNKIEGLSAAKPVPAAPSPNRPQLGGHRQSQWTAAKPAAAAGRNPNASVTTAAQRLARLQGKLAEIETLIRREQIDLSMQGASIQPNGEIHWRSSERVVEYDHDLAKQQLTRITFRGGKLFLNSTPFDTRTMFSGFSGPGYAIYVVSAEGNMHVGSHNVGHRHHSSLLAGKAVAGAGELRCVNGQLVFLSNKSGHYKPSLPHLVQVIHLMAKNQVPPTFAVTVLPAGRFYADVNTFLRSIAPEDCYQNAKLRRYWPYLKDEVLALHQPDPWRTFDPEREPLGVYCVATGRMIHPKVVRQWLKSQGMTARQRIASGAGR